MAVLVVVSHVTSSLSRSTEHLNSATSESHGGVYVELPGAELPVAKQINASNNNNNNNNNHSNNEQEYALEESSVNETLTDSSRLNNSGNMATLLNANTNMASSSSATSSTTTATKKASVSSSSSSSAMFEKKASLALSSSSTLVAHNSQPIQQQNEFISEMDSFDYDQDLLIEDGKCTIRSHANLFAPTDRLYNNTFFTIYISI